MSILSFPDKRSEKRRMGAVAPKLRTSRAEALSRKWDSGQNR